MTATHFAALGPKEQTTAPAEKGDTNLMRKGRNGGPVAQSAF
jgi:hypothetical protein